LRKFFDLFLLLVFGLLLSGCGNQRAASLQNSGLSALSQAAEETLASVRLKAEDLPDFTCEKIGDTLEPLPGGTGENFLYRYRENWSDQSRQLNLCYALFPDSEAARKTLADSVAQNPLHPRPDTLDGQAVWEVNQDGSY